MKSIAGLVGTLVFLCAARANAELKTANPTEVCAFLRERGLVTRGWKDMYGAFSCSSPYKELVAAPLSNNLAFYVDGQRTVAVRARLVLNVNDRAQAASAHRALLDAAKTLCLKATGSPLPATSAAAIRNGKSLSARVAKSSLRIVREDWPTGRGYEVRVEVD